MARATSKTAKTVQKTARKEVLKESLGKEIAKAWRKEKVRKELKSLAFFLAMLGLATFGRVALQGIPSVEPIIPIAIAMGMILGIREGFLLGGSAYVISNFFIWGFQGPWTIFQALGAAVPGAFGGIFGKYSKAGFKTLMILSIVGTMFFEVVMNISGAFMGIGLIGFGLLTLPLYFMTSLPFSLAHIGSNTVFALMCKPLLKLRRVKDEFKVISVRRSDGVTRTDFRMFKSDN